MLDFTLCSLIFYLFQVLIMSRYFFLPWMGQYVWFLTCSALFSKGNLDYEFIFVATSIILLKHMVIVDLKGDWKSSKRCDERRDRLTGRWEREAFQCLQCIHCPFQWNGISKLEPIFYREDMTRKDQVSPLIQEKTEKMGRGNEHQWKDRKKKMGKVQREFPEPHAPPWDSTYRHCNRVA